MSAHVEDAEPAHSRLRRVLTVHQDVYAPLVPHDPQPILSPQSRYQLRPLQALTRQLYRQCLSIRLLTVKLADRRLRRARLFEDDPYPKFLSARRRNPCARNIAAPREDGLHIVRRRPRDKTRHINDIRLLRRGRRAANREPGPLRLLHRVAERALRDGGQVRLLRERRIRDARRERVVLVVEVVRPLAVDVPLRRVAAVRPGLVVDRAR